MLSKSSDWRKLKFIPWICFHLFKVVWIGIVGKMLILPKKIDKWDSPVMFEGLGGK